MPESLPPTVKTWESAFVKTKKCCGSLQTEANQVDKLKGVTEEDKTYANAMISRTRAEEAKDKFSCLHWDSDADRFILDVSSFLRALNDTRAYQAQRHLSSV